MKHNEALKGFIWLALIVFVSIVVFDAKAQHGWDTYYDDLRFPANVARVGAGAGNAADIDLLGYLLYDNVQDEEAFFIAQFPHGYEYGSTVGAHVHWAKSTSAANDVCWRVDYDCKDIGETFTGSLGTTLSLGYVIDDADTANLHALAGYDFDPAFDSVSGICIFRVWRDVSGDGGTCADDYAADAILYEFDLHVKSDRTGSRNLYTKW